jgi:hypothetical protein
MSAVLAGLASACVGTSTGNPAAPPDEVGVPSEGGGSCDSTKTPLASLDAESPLGFSAADILELAQDHGEVTLEWLQRGSVLTYGPESGTGTLTIDLDARDTAPRYVDRSPKSSSSNGGPEPAIGFGELETSCPDTVELDVTLHVKSGGGALDETFDATLSAKTQNIARIYVQRKAAELAGSFDVQLSNDPTAVFESVQFDMTFSALGPSGTLEVGLTQKSSGSSNSSATSSATNPGPVARWPANVGCESGTFSARVDQRIGQFSAQDGLDRFNAASLRLTAAGSAATTLHASFAARGSSCAILESGREPAPTVQVSGDLTLRTDDGRIDGKWPVQLGATAASDGSLGQVKVGFDLYGSMIASLVEAPAFESTYGVHGFDLTSYDQAGLVLTVMISAANNVSGELVVNGVKRPDCQVQAAMPVPDSSSGAPSQGSPGCAGLSFVPLWTANISSSR